MESTPTIRILDIPTNTTFQDLLQLVSIFHSKRIKLPRDQEGQAENRGFAFVTFDSHDDALRAKETLNKHAYGTNILHAEWSRNYLNYLNASEEEKRALDAREGTNSYGGGRDFGRRRGPQKFFDSSKGKK